MFVSTRIEEEIEALERLDLEGLRAAWRERLGAPPRIRSPELLRRMLAWRMQAEVFGTLDPESRRRLRRPARAIPEALYNPGVVLTKEYGGQRHRVEVTVDGYLHEGKSHRSLSGVARAITGVRWNGPRFFGLRQEAG